MLADLLDGLRSTRSSPRGRRGRCRRSTGRSPAARRRARAPRSRPRRRASGRSAASCSRGRSSRRRRRHACRRPRRAGWYFSCAPCSRIPCSGWMNVRADVAVLDQPLAERDAARAREADRGGRARLGDRQHEVGVDRRLGGEPLAHPHARARAPRRPRAACPGARGRRTRRCRARRARPARRPAPSGARPRRRGRARPARPRARRPRRRGRARTSPTRRPTRRRGVRARAAGSRAGRGTPASVPSESATTEYAPSSLRHRAGDGVLERPGVARRSAPRSARCRTWRRASRPRLRAARAAPARS